MAELSTEIEKLCLATFYIRVTRRWQTSNHTRSYLGSHYSSFSSFHSLWICLLSVLQTNKVCASLWLEFSGGSFSSFILPPLKLRPKQASTFTISTLMVNVRACSVMSDSWGPRDVACWAPLSMKLAGFSLEILPFEESQHYARVLTGIPLLSVAPKFHFLFQGHI